MNLSASGCRDLDVFCATVVEEMEGKKNWPVLSYFAPEQWSSLPSNMSNSVLPCLQHCIKNSCLQTMPQLIFRFCLFPFVAVCFTLLYKTGNTRLIGTACRAIG